MQTHVTQEGRLPVDYQCAHCGYATTAWVRGKGHGVSSDGHMAEEEAFEDLSRVLYDSLLFASCPQCGEHDRTEAQFYRKQTLVRAILLAMGMVILTLLVVALQQGFDILEEPLMWSVVVPIALVPAGAYFAHKRQAWSRVTERVIFAG